MLQTQNRNPIDLLCNFHLPGNFCILKNFREPWDLVKKYKNHETIVSRIWNRKCSDNVRCSTQRINILLFFGSNNCRGIISRSDFKYRPSPTAVLPQRNNLFEKNIIFLKKFEWMNLTRKSGTAHQHCKVQTEIKFPAEKKTICT